MLLGMKEFIDKMKAEEKDDLRMSDNDLFNIGEELVESGHLVENTIS